MELKTMILDGIEYVLVPRDIFERKEEKVEETEVGLNDFQTEESLVEPEIKLDSVILVDSMPGVKKAQGSTYGYRERLKAHKLKPEDVMVLKTNFDEMPETPEIARNDFKRGYPPGKWGFYGPGAERDLG